MAIDAAKMTMSTQGKRGGKCVSATATGRRRQCRLQPTSPGLLVSALMVVLRGGTVSAPPPSLAFTAGPRATLSFSGRCGVCMRDVNRAAARTARCGVCLMATAGGDKEEEKMEFAAEVGRVSLCLWKSSGKACHMVASANERLLIAHTRVTCGSIAGSPPVLV